MNDVTPLRITYLLPSKDVSNFPSPIAVFSSSTVVVNAFNQDCSKLVIEAFKGAPAHKDPIHKVYSCAVYAFSSKSTIV